MRDFTAAHTTIECTLTFERMLGALPGPGSDVFKGLAKELHAYGIRPDRVTTETSSPRLSDVAVVIGGLLGDRLTIRFRIAEVSLLLPMYADGDYEKLVAVLLLIVAALKELDSDSVNGKITIRVASHLKLAPGELDALLREHLPLTSSITSLKPEALAYQIDLGPIMKASVMKASIAESIGYPGGLFLEVSATYPMPVTSEIATVAQRDLEQVYELFGLRSQPLKESDAPG
jgi:hypothetical protein